MYTNACFDYRFHPVGQGLFASGCLFQAKVPMPRFLWVYDCGSVSFGDVASWNERVCSLKRFAREKAVIDLLTLSHFDMDHISGVTALLAQFRVETLLLPYAPLWDRLEAAFAEGMPFNSAGMRYLIDPEGFLRGLGNIGRIIFVLPSDNSGEVPTPESGRLPPPDGPWKVMADTITVHSGDSQVLEFGMAREMELLPSQKGVTVEGLWEFVPYNRARRQVRPEFEAEVNRLRAALLNDQNEAGRAAALATLKSHYETQLATNSRARNNISLFLYAGPVYATWDACRLRYCNDAHLPTFPARICCYRRLHWYAPAIDRRCSVLYSGDGYLNTDRTFQRLRDYLRADRVGSLAAFQVNHHGAKGNWHAGLAQKLNPYLSVFSSDPTRAGTGHPDQEVWDDYEPHNPVQVNTVGNSAGGWLLKEA